VLKLAAKGLDVWKFNLLIYFILYYIYIYIYIYIYMYYDAVHLGFRGVFIVCILCVSTAN
jgi:hypothetical protein